MRSFLKLLPQQLIPERSVWGIPHLKDARLVSKRLPWDAHTLLMFCVGQQRPQLCQNALLAFCKSLLLFFSAGCATLPRPPQNNLNFPFQCQPGHQWSKSFLALDALFSPPGCQSPERSVLARQSCLLLLQSREVNDLAWSGLSKTVWLSQ